MSFTQGNRTHQLHLKEILPVFKLTHISEFSNSLTSAVDSLCSHGFTYTSVQHFIQRVQSPSATASNPASSPQKPSQRDFLHGVQGHLSKCPHIRRLKMITLQRAGKIWKEGIYICLNCQTKLEEQVLQRMTRTHTGCFPGTVFSREGELCIQLSGQRLR